MRKWLWCLLSLLMAVAILLTQVAAVLASDVGGGG